MPVVVGLGSYGILFLAGVALFPDIVAITILGQIALGLWVLSASETEMSPFNTDFIQTSFCVNYSINFNAKTRTSHASMGHVKKDFVGNFVNKSRTMRVFSLYDGHNGDTAARFVSKNLPYSILTHRGDFTQAYSEIDQLWWKNQSFSDKQKINHSGCTAATVLIEKTAGGLKASAANVGDIAILIIRERSNQIEKLYTEHSLQNPSECERLRQLGLTLQNNTHLVRSRGFGDYLNSVGYKNIKSLCDAQDRPKIAAPAINSENPVLLHAGDRIVLATDGVYKAIMNIENGRYALNGRRETMHIDDAFDQLCIRMKRDVSQITQYLRDEFLDMHQQVTREIIQMNALMASNSLKYPDEIYEVKLQTQLLQQAKTSLSKFDDASIVVYTVPEQEIWV